MALTALSRHARRVPPTPKLYLKTASTLQKRPFTQTLLERPVQIYRSTATDPYLNLSIEHCLLQRSHPDSTVLFLYANRPCVVIGRNQNPWLEVNLHLLREGLPPSSSSPTSSSSSNTTSEATLSTPDVYPEDPSSQSEQNASSSSNSTPIALVRRRSGGGAVFHDQGNINWSVICPPAAFDRDKHAAMVVRALARLGVGGGVRVNGRHDIVMDVSEGNGTETTTFKVSGSAYKLTRTRSLHHGTCLLSSEHLGSISRVLRSPAERFIKARGVESVRSRIRNVGVGSAEFVDAVVGEFAGMYGAGEWKGVTVGEKEAFEVEEVVKGMKELTSPEWIFGQTPHFTFSTHPTEEDPRERPELPDWLPHGFRAHFTVRHGEIQSAAVSGLEYQDFVDEASQDALLSQGLVKKRLHHINDWTQTLTSASPVPVDAGKVGEWLNYMFGIKGPREEGGGAGQSAVDALDVAGSLPQEIR